MMQYLKKSITILETQKKQLNVISNARDFSDKGQTKMLKHFQKYEEVGLTYYAKEDDSKKNFTHPKNEAIRVKVEESLTKWKNPYRESYYWIKAEFSDAYGMYGGLEGRENLQKEQLATDKKIKAD
jgi:hypothetical protein